LWVFTVFHTSISFQNIFKLYELVLDVRSKMLPTLLVFWFFSASVSASYVPQSVACPTTPLVRLAPGISDDEEAYRVARKPIAYENLRARLMETNPGFGTLELPIVSNPSHD
jgi:hypothetical protein